MKTINSLLVLLILIPELAGAQQRDILLAGARVIDPKNGIDAIMDVAIHEGRIVEISSDLSGGNYFQKIDLGGYLLVPGLIDIHTHNFFGTNPDAYLSNSFEALPPDGFTFRSGVTTVVDVGGTGWRDFDTFKKQTIDNSRTRVLCFLNIVGSGMRGGKVEQNLSDMDPVQTAAVARANPDHVVGIKLAHYFGPEWDPTEKAVEAGRIAGIPVMIDFGGHEPELSLETLLLEKLRPGDIFTHMYAHFTGRIPVVDEHRKLRPYVLEAQKRGIIFDVGHGGGSFIFDQAIPALDQGLKPNTISTDLHTGSMNGGMKDMTNVMSKFLNMGVPLPEVIEMSTWKPAQVINRPALGHLSVGAEADIAVLKLTEGQFGFVDTKGWRLDGNKKLVCELTLRNGEVVWDLNGIASPMWEE